MNALEILNLLPSSKKGVVEFFNDIKECFNDENVDSLRIARQFKSIAAIAKKFNDDKYIQENILTEAYKYGSEFETVNAKFNIKEFGTKYDFSNCDSYRWEELQAEIMILANESKSLESFLKSIKESKEDVVDEEF